MALRLCVYLPLVVCATVVANRGGMSAAALTGWFAAGVLLWTPLEYLVHRFVFHAVAPHYQHHVDPTDPTYILAPMLMTASMALAIWGLLTAATGSWRAAGVVVAGVLSGYLVYEGVHLLIHSRIAGGGVLRALRKHHYHHHFANDEVCYGVTSPLWDAILRTARQG